ncbi:CRISPR-associated helicase/endonuclease Cas3 [Pelosinus propionicus]|uniref:CRISPR-associated helicase, Cas3 family n=1 Tax=Pelosinus propionicus DSM 13327 TaxID=1123291 RepID=A0A1I4NPI2_9FIRM|nr:CRISPR-associated helicase/endonuclease Cas3 [Pelosinus propionicus]SFM17452.1 CRISPR-associated helicase, Cas3 family [Pelosinus propionicus DSM 13327]
MIYYGHTKENLRTKEILPKEHWQSLKEHLDEVARLAEERAAKFGAGKLGRIIGLAHDIGKYSKDFQKRLEGNKTKVDHATAGAQEICRKWQSPIGKALAFTVAGHHGGLPDGYRGDIKNLPGRLEKKDIPDYQAFAQEINIPNLCNNDLRNIPHAKDAGMSAFSSSFCIRMLYSCLVDADYLDTERFMDAEKYMVRPGTVSMEIIFERLEKKLAILAKRNRKNTSVINTARQDILKRCLQMADSKPNLFTLTVPTGGGKTYSSMAFALKHAVAQGKERVIYVIPYTSIIEQNAQVFREALEENDNVVLEHHSNFEYPEGSFEDWDKYEKAHRLAAENWDMPVVVTTAVQFFESLYANKGSRCRKLHNMANSVIVLDEAQMMPLEYMKPCLWALTELVLNYGATVVLCTATQPAIKELVPGNLEPVEIMEDPAELQKTFKRVSVQYRGKMTDNEVIAGMMENSQVLTIVNTRRHARILFDLLLEQTTEGVYHLSARMCPAHRKAVLAKIKKALLEGKSCRVVSTQLIEAGVDVDFPAVYRSAAGIDSIAQAAGRCNREGRRKDGLVIVFEPEAHGMPTRGRFELVAGLMRSTERRVRQFENDLMSLAAIEDYFKQLLSVESDKLDAHKILSLIKGGEEELSFPFVEIASKFQLIDSATVSVIVPWDDHVLDLMEEIEYHPFPASRMRSLQPYIVQVYQYELEALQKEKVVKSVGDIVKFVTDSSFYDSHYGLKDANEVKAPTDVMIY